MDKRKYQVDPLLGGKNLLYTLTILCLIVTIFLFNTVSFIFKPILLF